MRRGQEFGTDEVVKTLGISRAHASMVLAKVVKDTGPIERVSRGVYGVEGAAPAPRARRRRAGAPTRKK